MLIISSPEIYYEVNHLSAHLRLFLEHPGRAEITVAGDGDRSDLLKSAELLEILAKGIRARAADLRDEAERGKSPSPENGTSDKTSTDK